MSEKVVNPSLYDENELVIFEEGLFGFEENKKYLPLPIEEGNNDILSLLCVEDDTISFVIMNPFALIPEYNPTLSSEDYKKLEVENDEQLSFYAVCVIGEKPELTTVNLKSPIVVNAVTRKAVQVILQSDSYGFRHSFSEFPKKEG